MSTDATLAAIDGALQDYETSGDAMRWTPVPGRVICDGGAPLMPVRWSPWLLSQIDEELVRWNLAAIADSFMVSMQQFVANCARFGAALALSHQPVAHAMAVDICKAFAVPLFISDHTHARPARCRSCNPLGNPEPLRINGVAYHRRQRARARRRR